MTHKKAKRMQAAQPARMPAWLLAGGAVLLAIVAVAIWATSSPESVPGGGRGPQLAVNQDRIDFGKVVYDQPVRAEFKLQNSGDGVLTLDATAPVRVVEGCGPPRAVVGATTLKPGQSTILYTEFTMHAGMDGPHLFEVTLKTNDPQQREKRLAIASNWVPPGSR